MYFILTTALAIASFYQGRVNALPAPEATVPGFAQTVKALEANGQIQWSPTENGGRIAKVPFDVYDAAQAKTLSARDAPPNGLGGFTNIGKLATNAASYACQQSGEYQLDTVISDASKDACKDLVNMVPGSAFASKAYTIYQKAPIVNNAEGDKVQTIFRFFYNTAKAPKLDEDLCQKAIDLLTSSICQGKGSDGTSTRGGEVKIGSGKDYVQIGVDPNKA